jgi:DHA2 family multidrug resistance protein-like MFS transporter
LKASTLVTITDHGRSDGTTIDAPIAGRREWIGLMVLSLANLLYVMDLTVLKLAVPAISVGLQPSSTQLLWIIDISGFFVAGSLITMGSLGDRIGHRRLLLTGAAAFGVGSVLAGATLAPSTLSLIFLLFQDPRQRSLAIGTWIGAFSAGGAIGPAVGGLLLELYWWGSVFLLALPVTALLLVLGPRMLPEQRGSEAGRLDLPSATMPVVAVLATIYGLKQVVQDGLDLLPAGCVVAGLAVGVGFVRRQRTLADPVIAVGLFRITAFSAALAVNFLAIFVIIGSSLFVAQYQQLVLGLSPLQAGLWSLPSTVGFIVGSQLGPRLAGRVRPASPIAAGLVLGAVGLVVLTQLGASDGLALLVIGSLVSSLGFAPVFGFATELVVGSAPPQRAGAASAINKTAVKLGGALGIAVLGSIGVATYRTELANRLPAAIPAEAAAAARDTLGGAVAVASQLPDPLGAVVLQVAREAFVQGMQLSAVIAAVVAVGLAILAVVTLGGQPTASADLHAEAEVARATTTSCGRLEAATR